MEHGRDQASNERFLNCEKCMQTTPRETRQHWLRCGFEPLVPSVAWSPTAHDAPRTTVCPGYTCSLPEVIEASWARQWKEKGQLNVYLDGEKATPTLKRAIDLLDIEHSRAQSWDCRNPVKK